MTDYCKIGPVTVEGAHLYENNEVTWTGLEKFQIICTNSQARQLMGLASSAVKDINNNLKLIKNQSPWGPVWIDTSTELHDNEYVTHRGWYIINDVSIKGDVGPDNVYLEVTVEKISSYEYDYMEMDYTPGVEDGTQIDHTYTDTVQIYALDEDFSDFDTTTTWNAAAYQTCATPTATPISNELQLWATTTSSGTYGSVWTQTKGAYDASANDLTLEWGMGMMSTPTTYASSVHAFLSPQIKASGSHNWNDCLICIITAENWGYHYRAFSVNSAGAWTALIPQTTLTTPAAVWKLDWATNGNVAISIDTGAGYVQRYNGPTTLSTTNDLYTGFLLNNAHTSMIKARVTDLEVYNYGERTYNNIVALPSTTPLTSSDFTRTGADGDVPCYTNPTAPLYFWGDSDHLYDGSVRMYNSNYTDTTPRLVTWNDDTLTPDTFSMDNGLLKITTSSDTSTPVLLSVYAATPGAWSDLQIINPGVVNLVKPLYVSPERCTVQINDTKWTMNRGKQTLKVEHPYTSLGYSVSSFYTHDGGSTVTPGAGADITMTTNYYANVYNDPGDQYRFQVIQTDPTTIKSDTIPAAAITGLGFYDNTESSSSYNYYANVAVEFMRQTRQAMGMRAL